jgi:dihydropteroate synthase
MVFNLLYPIQLHQDDIRHRRHAHIPPRLIIVMILIFKKPSGFCHPFVIQGFQFPIGNLQPLVITQLRLHQRDQAVVNDPNEFVLNRIANLLTPLFLNRPDPLSFNKNLIGNRRESEYSPSGTIVSGLLLKKFFTKADNLTIFAHGLAFQSNHYLMEENYTRSKIEDKLFPPKITLNSRGKLLLLDDPWVMGIINITPNSFYPKSRIDKNEPDIALRRAEEMIKSGAKVLDIGGYSSRPGADEVSEEEELLRVIQMIENIKKEFPRTLLSIDTFRSRVAKESVEAGVDIVNDISGGGLDREMIPTVGSLNVPYICMHMRGTPKNMNTLTSYENLENEILAYFNQKLVACRKAGIKDVIIDPGLGFSKTLEQNYRILKNLSYFNTINAPILIGLSRKSMIYKILGITQEEALNGTTALNMVALMNGAKILRVHDVKEAVESVKLFKQLNA